MNGEHIDKNTRYPSERIQPIEKERVEATVVLSAKKGKKEGSGLNKGEGVGVEVVYIILYFNTFRKSGGSLSSLSQYKLPLLFCCISYLPPLIGIPSPFFSDWREISKYSSLASLPGRAIVVCNSVSRTQISLVFYFDMVFDRAPGTIGEQE